MTAASLSPTSASFPTSPLEATVQFTAEGRRLYGILHRSGNPIQGLPFVLMMVGGPQTRVGSHRSFVQIARALCAGGAHVLRFDYRGIGDADGEWVGYNYAESSMRAALDWIAAAFPKAGNVVLWSLCDGAGASMVFGARLGPAIAGMILCNPYVHGDGSKAESLIKHYYLRRLTDKGFWVKVIGGKFNPLTFAKSFLGLVGTVLASRAKARSDAAGAPGASGNAGNGSKGFGSAGGSPADDPTGFDEDTLERRSMTGILAFQRPILYILSTADIVADQFRAQLGRHKELAPLIKKGLLRTLPIAGANHTFSDLDHKRIVAAESLAALKTYL